MSQTKDLKKAPLELGFLEGDEEDCAETLCASMASSKAW
jgi:hypothetical protein